jgi:Flp pilus assembly protein TadD
MNRRSNTSALAFVFAASLWLSGCAPQETLPVSPQEGPFSELYAGQKRLTYNTEFPPASALEAEARGDRAWQSNDPDRAIYLYVQAMELGPTNPSPLYKIGLIHRNQDNLPLAERAFRRVLRLQAEHAGALEAMGMILLERRDYAEAAKALQRALEIEPDRWQAASGLGILADLQHDQDQAIGHYQRALALRPNSPELLNNLGYSQYLAGHWDAALETLRRAVALDPAFTLAWQNLGLVHTRAGRLDDAVMAFEHAGNRAAAYNNVGYLCMLDGRYAEAETYLLRAIDLSPRHYTLSHQNLEQLQRLRGSRFPASGGEP